MQDKFHDKFIIEKIELKQIVERSDSYYKQYRHKRKNFAFIFRFTYSHF